VIVQFAASPLETCPDLEANGVPIIGTTPDMIDMAETAERFQQLIDRLGLRQPPNRSARTEADALRLAGEIGYPLVVRPSYVLGGRAMEIVHEQKDLERYMREAVRSNDSPVLLDRFWRMLGSDVDAVSDGEGVLIGGVMDISSRPECIPVTRRAPCRRIPSPRASSGNCAGRPWSSPTRSRWSA